MISKNTSSVRSARGNIRAGLKLSTSCLKPRLGKSRPSSCAKYPTSPEVSFVQTLQSSGMLKVGSSELEYRMIGPLPHEAPTLVLLHEGLGSVGQWGDFPDRLATATSAGVFVYSRAGYGQSSPAPLPRPRTYMHDEALQVCPGLLHARGVRRCSPRG